MGSTRKPTLIPQPRRIMKHPVALMLSLLASTAFLMINTAQAELPQVSNARVIQPPPGAKVAAAYLTLTNSGNQALNVTGVSSDAAKRVELHLSVVENDVAKMLKQDSIVIPAGETLEFKHGSYHVMLMGLTAPLRAGSSLNLSLLTSAGTLPVSVPIVTPDHSSTAQKKKMDHSGHNMQQKPLDETMPMKDTSKVH